MPVIATIPFCLIAFFIWVSEFIDRKLKDGTMNLVVSKEDPRNGAITITINLTSILSN